MTSSACVPAINFALGPRSSAVITEVHGDRCRQKGTDSRGSSVEGPGYDLANSTVDFDTDAMENKTVEYGQFLFERS